MFHEAKYMTNLLLVEPSRVLMGKIPMGQNPSYTPVELFILHENKELVILATQDRKPKAQLKFSSEGFTPPYAEWIFNESTRRDQIMLGAHRSPGASVAGPIVLEPSKESHACGFRDELQRIARAINAECEKMLVAPPVPARANQSAPPLESAEAPPFKPPTRYDAPTDPEDRPNPTSFPPPKIGFPPTPVPPTGPDHRPPSSEYVQSPPVPPWLREDFTKQATEEFLRNKPDGTFVVRLATTPKPTYRYVLTLVYGRTQSMFQPFDSLQSMVENYKREPIQFKGNAVVLRDPY